MARVFGVVATGGGLSASLLQSLSENATAEIAEARDENGLVTDQTAYSRETTASLEAVFDAADSLPKAGASITIGAVTGLVTAVGSQESNTGYKSCTIEVSKKDSATQVALA
jgi:hypothetical protein